ncbi:MAG TPA: hypothetical protein VFF81_11660 [Noviherbaspirillum sp.]|nr:hypothetical protein [Noviherbaspirillum sp.]
MQISLGHYIAPFAEGKKRKEFPDAFAVAILSAYATRTGECIAVVSEDKDFKSACDRYGSLLYFGSLPKLTEVLLADPSKIVELREMILEDVGDLEQYIQDGAGELNYYHSNRQYAIDETNIAGVSVNDIRIVGLGDGECTISFDANIETEHRLKWEDWAYSSRQDDYDWMEFDEWVSNDSQLTGIAKLAIDYKAKKVNEIAYVQIDDSEIEVSSEP